MNTFTFGLGFALIAVVASHSGSSYVTRHDLSHEVEHGHSGGGGEAGSYGVGESSHGHDDHKDYYVQPQSSHVHDDHKDYYVQPQSSHKHNDHKNYYTQPQSSHGNDDHKDYYTQPQSSHENDDHKDYYTQPQSSHKHDHKDYYAHPQYKFEYGVKDGHTGDHKTQWEHRDGDVVKGGYSFNEADGTKRVVEYTSDKKNGFNAVVKNIGHAHHPAVYGHHESHGHN